MGKTSAAARRGEGGSRLTGGEPCHAANREKAQGRNAGRPASCCASRPGCAVAAPKSALNSRRSSARSRGLERARDSIDLDVLAGELDRALRLETLPEPRRSCWDGLPMIAYGAETLVAATEGPKVGEPPTVRRFVNVLF